MDIYEVIPLNKCSKLKNIYLNYQSGELHFEMEKII